MNILQQILDGVVGSKPINKKAPSMRKRKQLPLQSVAQMSPPVMSTGPSPIMGAKDPGPIIRRGGTFYTPGEGPRIPRR